MGSVFALPPGADFPRALVDGLRQRIDGGPEAMARVEIFLNTRRMQRRVRAIMAEEGAMLLPRLRLITELERDPSMADLPPPVPPLRRRLELAQLISRMVEADPTLAPRSAIYDLADSLAALFDEMQGEDVPLSRLEEMNLGEHATHWERSLAFLRIAARYFAPGPGEAPDAELRRRLAVERVEARWRTDPPDHPVIVAGSTGSRGTTARLMRAVAGLPQGFVILPGFDADMPDDVWEALEDGLSAQDHPQARFHSFLASLGLERHAVGLWDSRPPPSAERNRLVSLALRPAPVTDQWRQEGPHLSDLVDATAGVTLIEAPSPRMEALSIALCLRSAVEDGIRAALITPDRGLTRQVTAALDRWGIRPDDSAGTPLALSAPGRFLRQVAGLGGRRLTAEAALQLLKHPLTHSGKDRGEHLRWTRELELRLRRHGPVFPTGADIRKWHSERPGGDEFRRVWAEWLAGVLETAWPAEAPLATHVEDHLALAVRLAAGGSGGGPDPLWAEAAGKKALAAVEELRREAPYGGTMSALDYAQMFTAILQRGEVREAERVDTRIMIWGTLEARVQGAELVILAGLNDGVWPKVPPPDPWLNRRMRHETGLLLPERQIGLSAHDFQMAVAAPRVVITRAIRSDEAQTVPSRWLNRLVNLMQGLPDRRGPQALVEMRKRGRAWSDLAARLDRPDARVPPEPRPSPAPPLSVRPRQLSVTEISRLIRDPYHIYARHVLRLRPLDPLQPQPDAALRGSVLHRILELHVREGARPERLMEIASDVLSQEVPWPAARRLWLARLGRAKDWLIAEEARRTGTPVMIERAGGIDVAPFDFRLTAKPDRIDRLPDGRVEILDYKTGAPPTPKQQKAFDKQLLLEAAMAERGAFDALGPAEVAAAIYIGLGAQPKAEPVDLSPGTTDRVWEDFCKLIAAYCDPGQGYTARRALMMERQAADYDHLSRFGEWDVSDAAVLIPLGSGEEQ